VIQPSPTTNSHAGWTGLGTALLDDGGRITDANWPMADLLGASVPEDLIGAELATRIQGFSFRNVCAALIDAADPHREVVGEVSWDHPTQGARSGRLVVSRLEGPAGPLSLVVRLTLDPVLGAAQPLADPLLEAMLDDRLKAHWQPIVELASGRPRGMEGLARYVDHSGRMVFPAEFLASADESGLIVDVGAWMASQAAISLSQLRRLKIGPPDLFATVNVSVRQLALDDVAQVILDAVDASCLPPEAMWVEITEVALMDGVALEPQALRELAEAGVRVGLDDFGTGFGSLSSLRDLPVSFVKIDRTFVAGLGRSHADDVIVASIVELAQALGLTVIAEGVETEAQRAALETLGCPLGQGYRWSPPSPLTDLVALLGRR